MAGKPSSGRTDVAKAVERQMRYWELARSQQHEPRAATADHEVQDFVSISRMVGAGGGALTEKLSQRLSWPVFDREILQAMAGDDRVRARLYEDLDERDLGWIESTLRWLMGGEFRREEYFPRLSETVLALARQGNAVFLGRGADMMLPRERGLRVYLVAPPEVRARRFAERTGVSTALAMAEVERIQQERTDFLRHHFGKRAGELTRHDVVVNTDRFPIAETMELVCQALRARGILK
ncbi:MAG: cytidylate kinase-like family protein [Phycisphaerae bacterium]|jgi:cytidylate kinase